MSWEDRLGDSHHKDKQDGYLMKITFTVVSYLFVYGSIVL